MSFETSIAFVIAMAIFAGSPGPGTFAVFAQALSRGRASAFALLTGITFGDIIYLVGAVYGLGVLATELGTIFTYIRYAGAVYLIWMGYQAWTSDAATDEVPTDSKKGKAIFAGFTISISNPKVMIFYLAFLPTFIDLKTVTHTDIAILAIITVTVIYAVLGSYILAANELRDKLNQPKAKRWFNRITGGLLFSAGLAVAARG